MSTMKDTLILIGCIVLALFGTVLMITIMAGYVAFLGVLIGSFFGAIVAAFRWVTGL